MGNQKQKWTAEEEAALLAGVAKHGAGKWKNILVDSEFAPMLANRSNVDLKDKWRNLGSIPGQGGRDSSTIPKAKETASMAAAPITQSTSPVSNSIERAQDIRPQKPQDGKSVPTYNVMILEALSSLNEPSGSDVCAITNFIKGKYEVPQNFRRLLSSKLRRLVLQGKLEKVLQGYKIKDDLDNKPAVPKQHDVRPRPLHQSSMVFTDETVEAACKTAARWVAEAENKAFVASEAYKEYERVSQMAEETEVMLALSAKYMELCSSGEYVLFD